MKEKPTVTLPAQVAKVIDPLHPSDPEKAQIAIEGADPLYDEIRIENTLINEKGGKVRLKPSAEVEITVEAPKEAVEPKNARKGST